MAKTLSKGLASRDIQTYFTDADLQSFAIKNGWAGSLDQLAGTDYLSIVATNIGGGKTDSVIKQKIYHQAEIQADGSIIDKVLIARENFGPTDDFFTTIPNNSYIRVYVPAGSELIQAGGFKGFTADKFKPVDSQLTYKDELLAEHYASEDPLSGTKTYEENGKTVFANWSVLGPGASKDLVLVYRLPFKVQVNNTKDNIVRAAANLFSPEVSAYSLKFQKQSGRSADDFFSEITYPDGLTPRFSFPDAGVRSGNQINFQAKTDTDKIFVIGLVQ
jgi:hypothetical protein